MNRLSISESFTLFHGVLIKKQGHPVVQFVVSLDESFTSKSVSGTWLPKQGLLIAPNYVYEFDARNIEVISLAELVQEDRSDILLCKK